MIQLAKGKFSDSLTVLGSADVPIYLLNYGQGYALIEGGTSNLAPSVLQQLQESVGDLSLVTHWLITHAHYDHCGLLPYLYAQLPSVTIYASQETARAFQSERAVAMITRLNAELADLPPVLTAFNQLPIELIADNDVINLSTDSSLRVIATAGHAKCMMSFFDVATETLFVSDALGEFVAQGEWCPLIFDNTELYRQSIAKIQAVNAKTIALAHHVILTEQDARHAPNRALSAIKEFTDLATQFLQTESLESTAELLSKHFYGSYSDFVPKTLHYQSMLLMLKLLVPL